MERSELLSTLRRECERTTLPLATLTRMCRLDRAVINRWEVKPEQMTDASLGRLEEGLTYLSESVVKMLEAVRSARAAGR